MESLYDHRNAALLKPSVHNLLFTDEPVHLFPVPQDNAVGTNDLGNAVTVFTFPGKRYLSKKYFRNKVDGLSGGGHYMQPVSPTEIAFAKTRTMVLCDLKNDTIKEFDIVRSLEKTILHANVADRNRNLFIFEIEAENPNSEDFEDITRSLYLMDLSGEKPRLVKKYEKPKGSVWSMHRNQVLFCDFQNIELKVFDSNLNPSQHAVEGALKKNKGKVDFVDVIPHPFLPFAVIYGGKHGAQYVCWNQTFRSEESRVIFGLMNAAYFLFSPDGRWVVFQKVEPDPKYTYLMPISEKYPNYLGSPILLEGATFDRDYFAWTNNPVNLVGSSNGKLYHYNLTKEGHPEAASYPSYWDYVVEKDLEMLRKAGKQGLKPKP